jgi:hypothetical protein
VSENKVECQYYGGPSDCRPLTQSRQWRFLGEKSCGPAAGNHSPLNSAIEVWESIRGGGHASVGWEGGGGPCDRWY